MEASISGASVAGTLSARVSVIGKPVVEVSVARTIVAKGEKPGKPGKPGAEIPVAETSVGGTLAAEAGIPGEPGGAGRDAGDETGVSGCCVE